MIAVAAGQEARHDDAAAEPLACGFTGVDDDAGDFGGEAERGAGHLDDGVGGAQC